MDGKITVITLVVTNQARSLEFFTEKVGFEKRSDVRPPGGNRWVSVGPQGQDLEMALWEVGSAVDPSQKESSRHWRPENAPPIVLQVADCRNAHQELSARGVEFVRAPVEHPWGTAATFKGLDGNLFSMNQRPPVPGPRSRRATPPHSMSLLPDPSSPARESFPNPTVHASQYPGSDRTPAVDGHREGAGAEDRSTGRPIPLGDLLIWQGGTPRPYARIRWESGWGSQVGRQVGFPWIGEWTGRDLNPRPPVCKTGDLPN